MNDMRGDNFPPEPTPIERGDELVAACNRWTAEVPTISNADQAGRCQALVDQLRLERDAIEAAWKKEREPFDQEIVLLRTKYRLPLEALGVALDRMKGLAQGWLDREKARLEHEAAERKRIAAEAEVAARIAREEAAHIGTVEAELAARRAEDDAEAARTAAHKSTERPAIRGEFSSKAMSLRSGWHAVITDEQKALKHFARHPSIRAAALAAVQKEATKQAKAFKDPTRAPPGVEFRNDEKAV